MVRSGAKMAAWCVLCSWLVWYGLSGLVFVGTGSRPKFAQ